MAQQKRLTKKEKICFLMSRGKVNVTTKNPLPAIPTGVSSKDYLIKNRIPGAKGTISGIELNTGGSYYVVKHQRKEALYHINDFTI